MHPLFALLFVRLFLMLVSEHIESIIEIFTLHMLLQRVFILSFSVAYFFIIVFLIHYLCKSVLIYVSIHELFQKCFCFIRICRNLSCRHQSITRINIRNFWFIITWSHHWHSSNLRLSVENSLWVFYFFLKSYHWWSTASILIWGIRLWRWRFLLIIWLFFRISPLWLLCLLCLLGWSFNFEEKRVRGWIGKGRDSWALFGLLQ